MVKGKPRKKIDALELSSQAFISNEDKQGQQSPFSILVNRIRERYDGGEIKYLKNRFDQMVYLAKLRLRFGEKKSEVVEIKEMLEGYDSSNEEKWLYVQSNLQKILGEFDEKLPPDQLYGVSEFLQYLKDWMLIEAFGKFSKRGLQRKGGKLNFLKNKYQAMSKKQQIQ